MRKGLFVVGRAESMGLGTHTEEFAAAMQPERVVVMDCMNGRPLFAERIDNSVVVDVRQWRARPQRQMELLAGAEVVVAFETFYDDGLTGRMYRAGVKTVLLPMWEWSPPANVCGADLNVCLTEHDLAHVMRMRQHTGARRNRAVLADWPASPFVNKLCEACGGTGKDCRTKGEIAGDWNEAWIRDDMARVEMLEVMVKKCLKCGGVGNPREINWPPKRFLHLAGNASHNRDGTLEVLKAARYLAGTGATITVRHAFPMNALVGHETLTTEEKLGTEANVDFVGRTADRAEMFAGHDVLLCPRRLPGHSLPVNEATGAGLPCVVNDLPDNARWPYRVPCEADGFMAFGARRERTYGANVTVLGTLLRRMARGEEPLLPCPRLPTWVEWATTFDSWVKGLS